MELSTRIVEGARVPGEEGFVVVFAAIGVTRREETFFKRRFASSAALERSVLFLNLANDPTIERLLTPRAALTAAEYLAWEEGQHVLVILADVTNYCEVLREVSAARGRYRAAAAIPATCTQIWPRFSSGPGASRADPGRSRSS